LGTLVFNADQTVGSGQDNYVLTYDDASGLINLEASAGGGGGDAWGDAVDDDIVPDADGTRDLGSTSNRFAELHVDTIDLNGTTLDGTTLADPGADRILFWDDSESETTWLTAGTGLSISTTTLSVAPGADFIDAITEIAAGIKSGVDGDLITGTAGTSGNLASWNADGDLVDSSVVAANVVVDGDIGSSVQAFDADTLKADTTDELTVGFSQVLDDHGEVSGAATVTPAFADSNLQIVENGGAFTLAPPSTGNGVITLEITNNASAGAITTSGFGSVTGDSFTTTDGDIFLCSIAKMGTNTYLNVVAHAGNA
jgi:hypothetical protein